MWNIKKRLKSAFVDPSQLVEKYIFTRSLKSSHHLHTDSKGKAKQKVHCECISHTRAHWHSVRELTGWNTSTRRAFLTSTSHSLCFWRGNQSPVTVTGNQLGSQLLRTQKGMLRAGAHRGVTPLGLSIHISDLCALSYGHLVLLE